MRSLEESKLRIGEETRHAEVGQAGSHGAHQ